MNVALLMDAKELSETSFGRGVQSTGGRGMSVPRTDDPDASSISQEDGALLYLLVVDMWKTFASVKRHVLTYGGKEHTRGVVPEQHRFGAKPGADSRNQRCMRKEQAVQDRAAWCADRDWRKAA